MRVWIVSTDREIDSIWTQEHRALVRADACRQLQYPGVTVQSWTCNTIDQPDATDGVARDVVGVAAVWLVDVIVQAGRHVQHHARGQVEILPVAQMGHAKITGDHEVRVQRVDLQDLDGEDDWQAIVVLSAVSAAHAVDIATAQYHAYVRSLDRELESPGPAAPAG
jgi:hypothetical protein